MAFEHYIISGGRRLRCGYTTGTCAALAAQGAARLLLTGKAPETAGLMTPKGLRVEVPLTNCRMEDGKAVCQVTKDAGDDIDVTDGLAICARVGFAPGEGITLEGGAGVGRVTKPGLDQSVGQAAINRVPRQMITGAVEAVAEELGYVGGLEVVIFVPNGEEAGKKTFNPHMGVVGGISILGTSGIVEPMSTQALVDTITLELRQYRAQGEKRLILTPGNYGLDFLRKAGLGAETVPVVKFSNFVGETLDAARLEGFEEILVVGHLGKLVKVAGGVMNTHSRWADCRAELICAHAAVCGCTQKTAERLMGAATTDACLDILEEDHLLKPVLERLLIAIDRHLTRRAGEGVKIGTELFTNQRGFLGMTNTAKELLNIWKK